jgi:hypothetical protein
MNQAKLVSKLRELLDVLQAPGPLDRAQLQQTARAMYAASKTDDPSDMKNERYQRTITDETAWAHEDALLRERRRAMRKPPATIPGVHDYFTLSAKHGRPYGAFEKDRQLPYNAAEDAATPMSDTMAVKW